MVQTAPLSNLYEGRPHMQECMQTGCITHGECTWNCGTPSTLSVPADCMALPRQHGSENPKPHPIKSP